MKRILNVTVAVCLYAILLVSCEQPSIKQSAAPHTGNAADADVSQTNGISVRELSILFSLTRTKITASDAAKKIADSAGQKKGQFTFTETEALAYDDKEGTFTVRVKGTKNGKIFEKTVAATGFLNPYAAIRPAVSAAELDFSNAIEHNTKLSAFITQANASIGTVLKRFAFSDNNGNTETITKGNHSNYSLTAELEEKDGKIKIKPRYTVKHLKKEAGGAETSTDENCSHLFVWLDNTSAKPLTQSYFSKDDVFKYLIGKTDNTFLNVYPDKFASRYYAFLKYLNATPGGEGSLLNDAVIQDIIDLYKNDGGHLKMKICASVYKPREGGIKADDYTETLEIQYCIAEEDQIEAMLHGDYMNNPIVAIKEAKRSGFRTVTKENAADLFKFQIKLTADPQAGNKWKQKSYSNHPLLRSEYDSNLKEYVYKVNNPFKNATAHYTVTVNSKEPEGVFAYNPQYFSECADGTDIFIEHIYLDKESGSDALKIRMKFTGDGEEIVIEKQPE